MNATPPVDVWAGLATRNLADEKMEQVRELLFGDFKRSQDVQIAALDARLREMESVLTRRLAEIEARLDVLAGRAGADRREAFEELSRNVTELGRRIREIAR